MNDFMEVLFDYENIIFHLIKKYGIRDTEKEFYQEGVIALWRAAETYHEDKGKLSSYAYFKIEKAFLNLINKRVQSANKDNELVEATSKSSRQLAAYMETSFDPYLLEQLKQALSEKQMTWFKLYVLGGLSIREIAQQENTTIDAVKNWARNARPKIQAILEKYDLDSLYI